MKINKKKNEVIMAKRRNRIRILGFLLSVVMIGISINMFFKLETLLFSKEELKEKNSFLLSESFLTRKKDFYKDEKYKKDFFLTKKDWNEDKGGLKIDERNTE
ncbi:MAG: hypothetical protein ACRC6A_11955 [Fusobacteriaceae bacterium]